MSTDRDSGPVLNSAYYRERFGSRSPEEYKSLRVTNIDPNIPGDDLRNVLEKLFARYGDMHCKIVRQNDVFERIAYVNFELAEDAQNARRKAGPRVMSTLGRKVRVDPANVIRDQAGKILRRTLAPGAFDPYRRSDSRSPPPRGGSPYNNNSSRRSANNGGGGDYYDRSYNSGSRAPPDRRENFGFGGGGGRRSPPPSYRPIGAGGGDRNGTNALLYGLDQHPRPTWQYTDANHHEDQFASRTLFVGNLELDISITELRRCFERFGIVEEIDVKTPHEAVTAYAFIRFSDIWSAREARKQCSGEYLRDNRCKIGWGKPIITRRLWVGNLGPETSLAWLEKEFDRYGAVEKIDFTRGDNHAYVLFVNQEAAVEAWKKLKGLKMKNGVMENCMQVDFTDASMYDPPGTTDHSRPPLPPHNLPPRNNGERDHYKRRSSYSRSPDRSQRPKRARRSPSPSPTPVGGRRGSRDYSRDRSTRRYESGGRSRSRQRSPALSSSSSTRRRRKSTSGRRGDDEDRSPSRQTGLAAAALFAADTFGQLNQIRSPIWTGVLVLKRSAYPLQLFKMAGDDDLVDAYLRNERGESVQMNVTQRLKLDQPRTGEILRVSAAAMQQSAYLLAVPNPEMTKVADMQSKPLKTLVQYLEEKQAAGVVNTQCVQGGGPTGALLSAKLPSQGVVYAFPRCTFADDFVATLCPKLTLWQRNDQECLLLVIQKGPTPSASLLGGGGGTQANGSSQGHYIKEEN